MTYLKDERELIDILTVNELYTIISSKTGYIHMDENRCCYIFTSNTAAKAYCMQNQDLEVSKTGYVTPLDLLALLYRYGFARISINNEKTYEIYEKFGYRYFCNPKLSSLIFQLKETRKKHLLPDFAECNYILPVNIESTDRMVPEILYPTARKKEALSYLPLFSDLEEYAQWEFKDKWSPVLIDFKQVLKCANKDGIILNPASNRLTLGQDKLTLIKRMSQTETIPV